MECIDITDLAQNKAFHQEYNVDEDEDEEQQKKNDHFGAPGFEISKKDEEKEQKKK